MATSEEIDRVKAAVNIVDVVSPYVALKRSGPVWKGLCPFHSEKSPSFSVNPDKGFWYCFGCSSGGDAFKFLERIENLSFGESLERIAQMAGITLTRSSRESAVVNSQRERLYQALALTASYYQEMLAKSEHAKQYLHARGIAPDTIASFRLGYAGESHDGLAQYLQRHKVEADDACEAGVLTRSDRGQGPYDKMRTRIICPILDVHDRPIAFGGRLMEDIKDKAKYLNTAETPLFSKGKTFFAMSRARKSMGEREYAVVVEGYFDVISAHQSGFTNVVATLGTASTPEHADLLRRQVQRVILAFDADAAGFKAAQRASAIFEAKEMETLVLDMPRGEDPDSLLRAGRTADFQKAIDNAVPIREFQLRTVLEHYLSREGLTEAQKSTAFRREALPLLKATQSVLERERYIRMAAPLHPYFEQGSALAEEQIRQEISGIQPQPQPQEQRSGGYAAGAPGRQSGWQPREGGSGGWGANGRQYADRGRGWRQVPQQAGPAASPTNSGLRTAEESILRAMVSEDSSLRAETRSNVQLIELFVSESARELARRLLPITKENELEQKLLEVATSANDNEEDTISEQKVELATLAGVLLGNVRYEQKKRPGDTPPSTELGAVAPINQGLLTDSLALLRRHREIEREKQLQSLASQGEAAALQKFLNAVRNLHGGGAGADASAASTDAV